MKTCLRRVVVDGGQQDRMLSKPLMEMLSALSEQEHVAVVIGMSCQ